MCNKIVRHPTHSLLRNTTCIRIMIVIRRTAILRSRGRFSAMMDMGGVGSVPSAKDRKSNLLDMGKNNKVGILFSLFVCDNSERVLTKLNSTLFKGQGYCVRF